MLSQPRITPHRTGTGDAEEAGPSKGIINNRRPTLPAGIGAIRPKILPQPHGRKTPSSFEGRSLFKHFRISHLNCQRSRLALDELTKVRPREDILLCSEISLRDNQPPNVDRYTPIYHEDNPKICTYIKDSSLKYMVHHEVHPNLVRIHLTDNRTVGGIYIPPGQDMPDYAQTPMKEGEIRMGDFNAAHPDYLDTDPITARGIKLTRWQQTEECDERGPHYQTHVRGRKLDLIFSKDTRDQYTKVMHNGLIEHSDHTCQSIMIPLRVIDDDTHTKTDYQKIQVPELVERIKNLKLKDPQSPIELINQLEQIRKTLPTKTIRQNPTRLSQTVLEARRKLNRALRKNKANNRDEIRDLRLAYRKSLRDFNNQEIEDRLEDANENDKFYELNKRGTTKKALPPMKDVDNTVHRTHDQIAAYLAKNHGSGNSIPEEAAPNKSPNIDPVTTSEVIESLSKAPTQSTIGQDDIGIPLLKAYNVVHPINKIFTDILRSGIHPSGWKKAIVVPIPKANKPNYYQAKSWRSIHLLSLISKTLERIVLGRLQNPTTIPERYNLGATQFGSRIGTGTSDAFRLLMDWKKQAEKEGKHVTLVLSDVEGGFDKVNPDSLREKNTVDPRYMPWIYNWTRNRRIRFRFNGKTGKEEFITNMGLPQGSPLSPYLFGLFIKDIVEEDESFSQNVLIISYVDDILICVKGNTEEETEELTRAAWQRIKERADNSGMSFADNKTKTWHSERPKKPWAIGTNTEDLRFLGYWITSNGGGENHYQKHVKHWLTKANFSFNKIRALSQRSKRGLNTLSIIRLLTTVTRTMAWYGLEFYGSTDKRTKEVDSFLYETIRRLFDLPLATPH